MQILVIPFWAFFPSLSFGLGYIYGLLSLYASNPIHSAASIEGLVAKNRLALTHRGPIVPLAYRADFDRAASIKYSLIKRLRGLISAWKEVSSTWRS